VEGPLQVAAGPPGGPLPTHARAWPPAPPVPSFHPGNPLHRLYALDTVLPDLGTPTRDELPRAMAGHVLAQAELIGTYSRRH
jgi:phosphatidylethanolamine-binding protein (PEBP) family uncharacterized protein